MNTEQFWDWAERELRDRDLRWYGVERQTGLSNAAISKRARELLPPTFETCRAIARAFHLAPETVLRKAGLLPSVPEEKGQDEELLYHFHALPEAQRRNVVTTTRALHEEHAEYKVRQREEK